MNLFTKQKQTYRYQKQTYGFQRGKVWGGEDKSGGWDGRKHAAVDKTDNQQGPTVWHRELSSILCDDP